jgi:hypothetical protein
MQNSYPIVIGFSGKLGTGKDFLCKVSLEILNNKYNVSIIAYGDYLKLMCNLKYDISYERLYVKKDYESRKLLQKTATEERSIDDNIFIKSLNFNLKVLKSRNVDIVLISDVRFHPEKDSILSIGGSIIHILAPQRNEDKLNEEISDLKENKEQAKYDISNHYSETSLDDSVENEGTYLLNNDKEHEEEIYEILRSLLFKKILKK